MEDVTKRTGSKNFNDSIRRGLFKDKKLDKLWQKAQKLGLTDEELIVLKSEFMHHQVSIFVQLLKPI